MSDDIFSLGIISQIGGIDIWTRDCGGYFDQEWAMVFLNPTKGNKTITFALQDVGLDFFGGYEITDLLNHHADLGTRDVYTKFKYNVPENGLLMWYFVPYWH